MASVRVINTAVRDEFMRLTGLLVKRENAAHNKDAAEVMKLDERIKSTRGKIGRVAKQAGLAHY